MPDPTSSFQELLNRVQGGDAEAVGLLFTQYNDAVRRVVRRMLHATLRRRYDSADFAQSVWATFLDLPHANYSFVTPEELVAFLSKMAYNKVVGTARSRLGTGKHDMRRETSLDALHGDQTPLVETLSGRTHTPSQYVMAEERWEKIIENQPEGHVRVLELLRDGHSQAEIVRDFGFHPRVISRLLHRLRHFMEKE